MDPKAPSWGSFSEGLIAGMVVGLIFLTASMFTGCAGPASVKKQIAQDLTRIVDTEDCPTICAAVRAYLKSQLGAQ